MTTAAEHAHFALVDEHRALQIRHQAVLARLAHIETAAEKVCPSAGFLDDCNQRVSFDGPVAGWRELREALDAG